MGQSDGGNRRKLQRMKAAAIVFLATTGLICLVNLVSRIRSSQRRRTECWSKSQSLPFRGSGKWKIYEAV